MGLLIKAVFLQVVILILVQLTFKAFAQTNEYSNETEAIRGPEGRFLWGAIGNVKCLIFGNSTIGNSTCSAACALQGNNSGGYCSSGSCTCN